MSCLVRTRVSVKCLDFDKLYTQDYRPELLDELGITPYIQVDSSGKFFSMLIINSLSTLHSTGIYRPLSPRSSATSVPKSPFASLSTILGSSTRTSRNSTGFHANNQLVAHLAQHGYLQTSIPSLFRHVSVQISFCLVVDDFGFKYKDIAEFHRVSCQ